MTDITQAVAEHNEAVNSFFAEETENIESLAKKISQAIENVQKIKISNPSGLPSFSASTLALIHICFETSIPITDFT